MGPLYIRQQVVSHYLDEAGFDFLLNISNAYGHPVIYCSKDFAKTFKKILPYYTGPESSYKGARIQIIETENKECAQIIANNSGFLYINTSLKGENNND